MLARIAKRLAVDTSHRPGKADFQQEDRVALYTAPDEIRILDG